MRIIAPHSPRGLARLAPAKGFTLVEMLVSIAIFTIVMTTALGALLSMSEADRKAQTLNSAVNNLSFAMESMSRTIRTGQSYHCGSGGASGPQDCGSPSNVYTGAQPYLSFDVTDGSLTGCTVGVPCPVVYCMSSGSALSCSPSSSCGSDSSCSILRSINGGAFAELTAPEVQISHMGFYVKGAPSGDALQPKVNILISGFVPVSGSQRSAFDLQTSVTQRLYDQ